MDSKKNQTIVIHGMVQIFWPLAILNGSLQLWTSGWQLIQKQSYNNIELIMLVNADL